MQGQDCAKAPARRSLQKSAINNRHSSINPQAAIEASPSPIPLPPFLCHPVFLSTLQQKRRGQPLIGQVEDRNAGDRGRCAAGIVNRRAMSPWLEAPPQLVRDAGIQVGTAQGWDPAFRSGLRLRIASAPAPSASKSDFPGSGTSIN